jgi:hypothetical protein
MVEQLHLADTIDGAGAVALHRHFGVPSLGLQPRQIGPDHVLLKEIVLRSRVEYVALESCADDKPMKPDDMAQRFGLLLTCEATEPAVPLSALILEARRRADAGSDLAISFLSEFDVARRFHPQSDAAVEVILHGLIEGHAGLPRSSLVRRFLGNHEIVQAAGVD